LQKNGILACFYLKTYKDGLRYPKFNGSGPVKYSASQYHLPELRDRLVANANLTG